MAKELSRSEATQLSFKKSRSCDNYPTLANDENSAGDQSHLIDNNLLELHMYKPQDQDYTILFFSSRRFYTFVIKSELILK